MDGKRKSWGLRRATFAAIISSYLISFLTIFYRIPILTVVAFSVSVLGTIISLSMLVRSKARMTNYLDRAADEYSKNDKDIIENLPIPSVLINEFGRIIWYNSLFSSEILPFADYLGKDFESLLEDISIEYIMEKEEPQYYIKGDKTYEILISLDIEQSGKSPSLMLMFLDITKTLEAKSRYEKTRPIIVHLTIDNYDELFPNSKDSDKTRTIAAIEEILESFAASSKGVLKRLSREKYVMVTTEESFEETIDGRFPIIEHVRNVSPTEHFNVTISLGVGRGDESLTALDKYAAQATDMAQGRGGDQAVIKTAAGYEFYGGVSQGLEKRTKVKIRTVASAIMEIISAADNCIVMGHKYADLDSLGSGIGLTAAINRLGKDAYFLLDKEQSLVKSGIEILSENGYKDMIVTEGRALDKITKNTLLFIVDTHSPTLFQSKAVYEKCKNMTVVIDHHRRTADYISDALLFFHEPVASSASEMVTELIQYLGEDNHPTPLESEFLLAGITLDTKNFVFRTGVRTFEAAAYLRKNGANTIAVKQLFSGSLEAYQKKTQLVTGATFYGEFAVAFDEQYSKEMRIVAPQTADELLLIDGIKASFVLYPADKKSDKIQISSRSMGGINVQVILEKIGGGGHLTMAGATLEGITMEEALEKVKVAIDEYMEENKL